MMTMLIVRSLAMLLVTTFVLASCNKRPPEYSLPWAKTTSPTRRTHHVRLDILYKDDDPAKPMIFCNSKLAGIEEVRKDMYDLREALPEMERERWTIFLYADKNVSALFIKDMLSELRREYGLAVVYMTNDHEGLSFSMPVPCEEVWKKMGLDDYAPGDVPPPPFGADYYSKALKDCNSITLKDNHLFLNKAPIDTADLYRISKQKVLEAFEKGLTPPSFIIATDSSSKYSLLVSTYDQIFTAVIDLRKKKVKEKFGKEYQTWLYSDPEVREFVSLNFPVAIIELNKEEREYFKDLLPEEQQNPKRLTSFKSNKNDSVADYALPEARMLTTWFWLQSYVSDIRVFNGNNDPTKPRIFWGGKFAQLSDFRDIVKKEKEYVYEDDPKDPFIVRLFADRNVSAAFIVDILRELRREGITEFAFMSDDKNDLGLRIKIPPQQSGEYSAAIKTAYNLKLKNDELYLDNVKIDTAELYRFTRKKAMESFTKGTEPPVFIVEVDDASKYSLLVSAYDKVFAGVFLLCQENVKEKFGEEYSGDPRRHDDEVNEFVATKFPIRLYIADI